MEMFLKYFINLNIRLEVKLAVQLQTDLYDYQPGKGSQAIIFDRGENETFAFENIFDQSTYLKKIFKRV